MLGWILSGSCSGSSAAAQRSSFVSTLDHELTALVQRFWEQEKEVPAPLALTPDEQTCEEIFVRTHKRNPDGRYQVRRLLLHQSRLEKPANQPSAS